jgi:hypothetical protein
MPQQDLTVSYGMAGITANGTTIASPDSSLKPDLRYSQGYNNLDTARNTLLKMEQSYHG